MYELYVTGCQGVDIDPDGGFAVRLALGSPAHELVAKLVENWPYTVVGLFGMTVESDNVVVLRMKDPAMAVSATKWFVETAAPEISAHAQAIEEARADVEKRVREHFEYLAT